MYLTFSFLQNLISADCTDEIPELLNLSESSSNCNLFLYAGATFWQEKGSVWADHAIVDGWTYLL